LSNIRVGSISAENGTDPVTLTKQSAVKYFSRTTGLYTGFVGDSLNASSLTDVGTGVVTVSFTNNFSNSNYCLSGMVLASSGKMVTAREQDAFVGSVEFRVHNNTGADSDDNITTSILGDLA